ncbi:hypothetical protein LTR56_003881 [Elasticomyces elasticus]|nr:hypothetical protein LTR22_022556 [Elasticomyces elasticus]KAK3654608.1 hypothetical protein LTR56_003881 [Elasticomyces elasticus]KAK4908012.1 hypothetical protein LTR49_023043 [Elasticomyces elasticus]KAK5755236.1 hypothetical protein LTS12_014686 [Elasticomyces elasticus]
MPTLKQITCSIELGSSNAKLKEYGARYSDGAVETFVAIPETGVPFVIHIESKGYIAPGLAVFVFIDGKYQSNRNKLGLKMPGDDVDPKRYEVDFMMRQKEEKGADGRFVGREWSFVELNTTTADKAATLNPNFLQNFGTIEVVVLRCRDEGNYIPTPKKQDVSQSRKPNAAAQQARASSAAKAKSVTAAGSGMMGGMMGGMFDGANDAIEDDLQLAPIISYDGAHDLIDFEGQSTTSTRIRTLTTSVAGAPTHDFGTRRAMYNVSPTPGANIQSPTPSMLDDIATYDFGPTRAVKKYYPKTPVRAKNPALMGDVLGDERTYDFCDRNANYHSPTAGAVPAFDYSTGKVKNHDLFAGIKTLDFLPGKDNHQDAFSDVTPFAFAPGYNENVTLEFTPEKPKKPKTPDLFEGIRTLDFSADESIKTLEFSTGEDIQYSAFGATGGHRDDKVYGGNDGTAEEDKNAQLDGMGGDIFINQSQYPSRAVDDMFGDKYLGLTGAARERMRRALRDNGHQVTESEVDLRHNTNYNRQSGAGPYLGRQPIMNPNLSMPPAANLNYDYQVASQAPRAPQKEVKIKPKSNVQSPPTFGSNSKIYCDQHGNLIFNGTVVAANQVNGLLKNVTNAHGIADRATKEHMKFMRTLPKTHPDLEKLDDQGEALFKNAKELEKFQHAIVDAMEAHEVYMEKLAGGEDLVAKMHAQQDAFRNSQANAATGDFQQVGEGVIGGGATHNQNDWQVPQNDQKPASNTGGWGAPEKNDAGNTNGWGGEEQKDAGGWGGEEQKDAGGWGDAAKAESKKSASRHSSHKTEAAWGNDQAHQDSGNAGWGTTSNKDGQNGGDAGGWGSTSKKGKDNKQADGWGDGAGQATPRKPSSNHGGYGPSTPTPQYGAKDYFKHWQQSEDEYVTAARASMKKREEPRKVYHYPAPQLPAVPEDKVNDVTHLVQPGRGADYSHRVARPVYMDSMERPYAVISFKYRKPETLETILKRDGIVADTQALVVYVEKEKLLSMPKDRLVEAMLQMKSPGGQQSASKKSGGQEKAASVGWGGNQSQKAASAAGGGGWGGSKAASNNGKTVSAAGWAGDNNDNNGGGGGGGWSNKGASNKPASAGGWGNENKENSGNDGGWNDNTNDAAPAAGLGWDGGNDARNGNPSNIKHGYTPKTKDFAYVDNQPEAYNTKVYKANYASDEPSMATGYGRDEKSEEDHAFDGNREFVRPTRGAYMGRARAARQMRGGMTPRRPKTPEVEEDAMAGGNLPSGW